MLPYVLSELRDLCEAVDGGALARSNSTACQRRRYLAEDDDDEDDLLAALLGAAPRRALVLRPRHQLRLTRRPTLAVSRAKQQQQRRDAEEDKKNALDINLDVKQFLPEELSVRVDKDRGCVVVEAAHEERPDEHGYIRRQFTRRYPLPADVDPDAVVSRLSADGVLRVSAPRKEALPTPEETVRIVPIQHSNRPAAAVIRAEDAVKESNKDAEKDAVMDEANAA